MAFRGYSKFMHSIFKYPLMESIGITTGGFFGSDLLCQIIEYKYKKENKFIWDKYRSFKFSVTGCMFGVQFYFWIPFVAQLFPGKGIRSAFKRVCFEASTFGPYSACFVISINAILDGYKLDGIKNRLNENWLNVWSAAVCVFGPGQLINYWLIPVQYRILFLNAIGFCWRVFLSYLLFGKKNQESLFENK
eukprot:484126_1